MPEPLTPETQAALNLSDAERINYINGEFWIKYPRAEEILDKLEYLLSFPKRHRMPNLLIVGDTNNGKTMIVQRFQSKHPAHDNAEGDGIVLPVLVIQAPNVPDEGKFYDEILTSLNAPFKIKEKESKKYFQILRILEGLETRMLIIDELHNIIAGSLNRQRALLNLIKNLGNRLRIPIVGVGTEDAYNAINTDPQLSNRFEPMTLPRWQDNDEYLRLLVSFETMIPLKKPSDLVDDAIADQLLYMSEGIIGELANILSRAAVAAIKDKKERISLKLLESLASSNWILPSERPSPTLK
ncbi:MAG: TniB family NTP-binding protein [Pyrinomonadaceae bacterium]